jgi:DNA end-binding protein Ku
MKIDAEMVQLAKQLIDRQTTTYDPSDLEDRYETRLRAMIDAKLQGQGVDLAEPIESDRGNVIDLMAALKKSLSEPTEVTPADAPKPVKETSKGKAAGQTAAKTPRKRA